MKILRHLPIILMLQHLFMTEESTKQMTWHKTSVRYSPDKMVHPSDGEAWESFNRKNPDKDDEAHNVHVALATDGFNPFGMMSAHTLVGPCSLSPQSPPGSSFNDRTYS
jgi:hypothetical protein